MYGHSRELGPRERIIVISIIQRIAVGAAAGGGGIVRDSCIAVKLATKIGVWLSHGF